VQFPFAASTDFPPQVGVVTFLPATGGGTDDSAEVREGLSGAVMIVGPRGMGAVQPDRDEAGAGLLDDQCRNGLALKKQRGFPLFLAGWPPDGGCCHGHALYQPLLDDVWCRWRAGKSRYRERAMWRA
jgi:hypothetical protein